VDVKILGNCTDAIFRVEVSMVRRLSGIIGDCIEGGHSDPHEEEKR
jgi:hypothetical protein